VAVVLLAQRTSSTLVVTYPFSHSPTHPPAHPQTHPFKPPPPNPQVSEAVEELILRALLEAHPSAGPERLEELRAKYRWVGVKGAASWLGWLFARCCRGVCVRV
jgi:hypothetical protein